MTHPALRQRIYQSVYRQYREWYGANHMKNGSCLYWTLTGLSVLLKLDYRALIQAGSMSWPILASDQDDTKRPTHFTYEWSPETEHSQAALKLGQLPEIHIWIGLPDSNELVDFSTKWLPIRAAKVGLGWETKSPPDFLWCAPDELPDGVIYKPHLEAIQFVLNRIQQK